MSKRIEWIDIAKGILIVLVVLGHSEISGIAASVINSFHMAAFFFLAGLTIMWTSYKINSRYAEISYSLHFQQKTIANSRVN